MAGRTNKRKAPAVKEEAQKQRKRSATPAKKAPAKRAASPATGRSKSPAPKKVATAASKKSSPAKSRSPSPAKTRTRSGTKTAAKSTARSPSPASKQISPSPSPVKKHDNDVSPGWEVVKSKKTKKAEKSKPAPKKVEMPVEKSGASRSSSRSRSSSKSSGTYAKEALASTENFRNETAIDDEQYIQYYFRTGIIDQWSRTVAMLASTIAPLFVAIPMYCYLKGDKESAQIGVVFVFIYVLVVALSVIAGLPAVLVQRVTVSTLTGSSPSKSTELEVLCLLLFILTGISLMVTMRVGGYITGPSSGSDQARRGGPGQ